MESTIGLYRTELINRRHRLGLAPGARDGGSALSGVDQPRALARPARLPATHRDQDGVLSGPRLARSGCV